MIIVCMNVDALVCVDIDAVVQDRSLSLSTEEAELVRASVTVVKISAERNNGTGF